jgi:hypothetical protein
VGNVNQHFYWEKILKWLLMKYNVRGLIKFILLITWLLMSCFEYGNDSLHFIEYKEFLHEIFRKYSTGSLVSGL